MVTVCQKGGREGPAWGYLGLWQRNTHSLVCIHTTTLARNTHVVAARVREPQLVQRCGVGAWVVPSGVMRLVTRDRGSHCSLRRTWIWRWLGRLGCTDRCLG